MATAKEKTTTAEATEAEKVTTKAAPVQAESVYTAEELADNAGNLFGVRTEAWRLHLKSPVSKSVRFPRQRKS